MHTHRTEEATGIDYYAGSDVTAGALTLLGHPIVHGVRISNHRFAEGIDVDWERSATPLEDAEDRVCE